MNNPGIDLEIWKSLRNKWAELQSTGHKVSVEFKLVSDANDKTRVLMIDVVQTIDDEIIVETVQKSLGEAYVTLGIDGLSMEQLVKTYKNIVRPIFQQTGQRKATLTVTMTPTSPTSGELRGSLEKHSPDSIETVQLNYRHYYVLNALREKMIEQLGEGWDNVTVVCRVEDVEFYFDYSSKPN